MNKFIKTFKISIILLFIGVILFTLFACQKASYEPGGKDIEKLRIKDISIKYNYKKEIKYYLNKIIPYKNNSKLSFEIDKNLDEVLSLNYRESEFYFTINFKNVSKTPSGYVKVRNGQNKEVAKFKITVLKNTENLESQIKILSQNLVGIKKTDTEDPNKLTVNKKYIFAKDYIYLKKLLEDAQKIYSNANSDQEKIETQTNALFRENSRFNTYIIEGKKNPEFGTKGSIIAISLFIFFVASALVILVFLFVFKNKLKKNKNKSSHSDIDGDIISDSKK